MSSSYSTFTFSLSMENDSRSKEINFQEISGLIHAVNVDENGKRGILPQLNFIPTKEENTNLVLKQGVMDRSSNFYKWCHDSLDGSVAGSSIIQNLLVHLTDENAEVIKTWKVLNARPIKMSVSPSKSNSKVEAVELLEFTCSGIEESDTEE